MSAANRLPAAMTVAEFLAWNEPSVRELVDGVPRAMAPPSPRHALIQAEAARLIGNRLADLRPACRVMTEIGVQPKVNADHNVRVPDLAVTCSPIDPEDRLLREPLVVVEILSPSNASDTRANVWAYTSIPTVAEILVLHAVEVRAELLRREEDGAWPDNPIELTLGDEVRLESIDLTVPLSAFYRTT